MPCTAFPPMRPALGFFFGFMSRTLIFFFDFFIGFFALVVCLVFLDPLRGVEPPARTLTSTVALTGALLLERTLHGRALHRCALHGRALHG